MLAESERELAEWIAGAGVDVYLRIGYEFDNPQNHYDPASFKAAFRRIAQRMALAAPNCHAVWHSWGFGTWGGREVSAWWPGADVVD